MWSVLIHSHAVHGALAGFLAAASVDYHAFTTWKSFHDAATYNWNTAALRWVQGAAAGVVASYTLGQMFPDFAQFGA
jgi:uncharacterized membrane protein